MRTWPCKRGISCTSLPRITAFLSRITRFRFVKPCRSCSPCGLLSADVASLVDGAVNAVSLVPRDGGVVVGHAVHSLVVGRQEEVHHGHGAVVGRAESRTV